MLIFQFIVIIFSVYCSISFLIKLLRAFKVGREKQIREGNFNRQGRLKGPKPLVFMLVSSPTIAIIILYISKTEITMANLSGGSLFVLCVEAIILATGETIQDIVRCYKKNGLIKTIFTVISVALVLAAVIYVKYKR